MSHSAQNQVNDNRLIPAAIEQASIPTRGSVVEPVPDSPLITDKGVISPTLQQLLLSLPRPSEEKIDEFTKVTFDRIEQGTITLRELNDYLQEAVFKKNADKFSYELTGVQPTSEQLTLLKQLGFLGEAKVAAGAEFDTAIVWGGTLAAVESRIDFLLDQGASFSQLVLLGTNTRTLDKGEKTHSSETEAAMKEFVARANKKTGRDFSPEKLPRNEAEMVAFAWEALKPATLEHLPAITIDTPGRSPTDLLAKYKNVPGTADTFGYLLLFAKENGLNLGTRFIAASSQPHVLRQTIDAEFKFRAVDYPFELLSGVGRENTSASLTLYLQEIAKLVNTEFRISILPTSQR